MNGLSFLRSNRIDPFWEPLDSWFNSWFPSGSNIPPLNLYQEGGSFSVEVAVPGFEESELSVQLSKGVLRISGEKKHKAGAERRYLIQEVVQRSFVREISLPEDCDPDSVKAELKSGILRISVSSEKLKKEEPKIIPISH